MSKIRSFIKEHFLHFNAATLVDASEAYEAHLKAGNKMFVTLAGAMSTAELGKSLAEMIRKDKIHAISCTGANLEEDIFNLVAHEHYKRVPHYRSLTPKDEMALLKEKMNRVTDTCIPEHEAIRRVEGPIFDLWQEADKKGLRKFSHEYFFELLKTGKLKQHYQIDPKNSWTLAAVEKKIPVFVPGWEDSTLGNVLAAYLTKGEIKNPGIVKSGIEIMTSLIQWYTETTKKCSVGFYQIGGGIAGDFPICVVPLINQDMKSKVPVWSYFCQVSDSTTSYGSYSGATPTEKITWGKLDADSPKFIIESDATIVAPLMFAYILGW